MLKFLIVALASLGLAIAACAAEAPKVPACGPDTPCPQVPQMEPLQRPSLRDYGHPPRPRHVPRAPDGVTGYSDYYEVDVPFVDMSAALRRDIVKCAGEAQCVNRIMTIMELRAALREACAQLPAARSLSQRPTSACGELQRIERRYTTPDLPQ